MVVIPAVDPTRKMYAKVYENVVALDRSEKNELVKGAAYCVQLMSCYEDCQGHPQHSGAAAWRDVRLGVANHSNRTDRGTMP